MNGLFSTDHQQTISAHYRPIPFWSWNDKLEPGELRRQIGAMQNAGMGGFFSVTEDVPVPPDTSTVLAADAEIAREAIMQTARMRERIFLVFFMVCTPFS